MWSVTKLLPGTVCSSPKRQHGAWVGPRACPSPVLPPARGVGAGGVTVTGVGRALQPSRQHGGGGVCRPGTGPATPLTPKSRAGSHVMDLVSGFTQNHEDPSAWVAPAAAPPHMHTGIIGFAVKPQALAAGKDDRTSEANESLRTLGPPASAAAPRSKGPGGSLHGSSAQKAPARAAGAAGHQGWGLGTCLLCPQRWGGGGGGGGVGGDVAGLVPDTCSWYLPADSFWRLAPLEFLIPFPLTRMLSK